MNEIKKCVWKSIVEKLSYPEGHLKVCNIYCDGLQIDCTNYKSSMEELLGIDSMTLVKSGLEKYFINPYQRSVN